METALGWERILDCKFSPDSERLLIAGTKLDETGEIAVYIIDGHFLTSIGFASLSKLRHKYNTSSSTELVSRTDNGCHEQKILPVNNTLCTEVMHE